MTESKQRVRFIEQAIVAQEEERARIARELHDGIGQSLTSLLVGLRSLEACIRDNPEARSLAAQLRDTAGGAIDEVRRLAQGLRPSALDDLGLGPAIERLIEEMGVCHKLSMDLQISGLEAEPRLPPSIEITLYRVVQEALNNVAKHAKASCASVVLERRADLVRLIVEDDGSGMDPDDGGGFGLLGIRERLSLVKGELTIESSDEGTAVFATIPCRPLEPRRFALQYADTEVPLAPGEYLVGRSEECEIRLDGRRVSRRHAKLMISEYDGYVEDLGSMNGVFVNGRRVKGCHRLRDGDGVVIGDEQVWIRNVPRHTAADQSAWGQERTLPGARTGAPQARDVTERANMLEIAGTMALNWLDQGRVADAERVLSGHLRQVMEAVRGGDVSHGAVVRTSIAYALRLAEVGKNPGWIRYALELAERTCVLPSAATPATLERLLASGVELPWDALRSYIKAIDSDGPVSGETGFALERLRKLLQLE